MRYFPFFSALSDMCLGCIEIHEETTVNNNFAQLLNIVAGTAQVHIGEPVTSEVLDSFVSEFKRWCGQVL